MLLLASLGLTTALAAPPWAGDPSATVWRAPGEVSIRSEASEVRLRRAREPAHGATACTGDIVAAEVLGPRAPEWLATVCEDVDAWSSELPPGSPHVRREPMGWGEALASGALPTPPVPRPDGVRVLPVAWPLRPLHLVVLAWSLALVGTLPRQRAPWIAAALALGVRWIADGPSMLVGRVHGYAKLLLATGTQPNNVYGHGFDAVLGPLWWVTGGRPTIATEAAPWLGSLAILWLTAWVAGKEDEPTALLAGVFAALLPMHVLVSGTESEFLLATTLGVGAMFGLGRHDRAGDLLALTSIGLLAHVRPLQLGIVGVLLLACLFTDRRAVGLGAGLIALPAAWRVATGLGRADDIVTSQLEGVVGPAYFFGVGGSLAPLDPSVTPLMVTALAVAATVSLRHRGWVRAAAGLALVGTLPYALFNLPTDVVRYQLPAQPWLAALAAGAVMHAGRARLPLAAVALLSFLPAARPLAPRTAWAHEHQQLRALLPTLGPNDRIRYDPAWDDNGAFETWVNATGHGVWVPLDRVPARTGELRWLGRADVWPSRPDDGCTHVPLDVVEAPAEGRGVETYIRPTFTVGLARLADCR